MGSIYNYNQNRNAFLSLFVSLFGGMNKNEKMNKNERKEEKGNKKKKERKNIYM